MTSRTLSIGDIGSWDAPAGSPAWVKRTHVEALAYLERTESDAEHLETYLRSLRQDNNYQKLTDGSGRPFLLWESYCTTLPPFGLGYDPESLGAVVQERKSAQARAAAPGSAPTHADAGRQGGRGRKKARSDNTDFLGRGAEYLTARIARDAPEVLAEMQAGQHPSVRAAAKRAGLVKDRWSVPAHSIEAMATYLRERLVTAERAELARRLGAE